MQTRGEEPSRQRARCQTSNAADVSGDQQGGKWGWSGWDKRKVLGTRLERSGKAAGVGSCKAAFTSFYWVRWILLNPFRSDQRSLRASSVGWGSSLIRGVRRKREGSWNLGQLLGHASLPFFPETLLKTAQPGWFCPNRGVACFPGDWPSWLLGNSGWRPFHWEQSRSHQVFISLLPAFILPSQAALLTRLLEDGKSRGWRGPCLRWGRGLPPGPSLWWLLTHVFSLLLSSSQIRVFRSGWSQIVLPSSWLGEQN